MLITHWITHRGLYSKAKQVSFSNDAEIWKDNICNGIKNRDICPGVTWCKDLMVVSLLINEECGAQIMSKITVLLMMRINGFFLLLTP